MCVGFFVVEETFYHSLGWKFRAKKSEKIFLLSYVYQSIKIGLLFINIRLSIGCLVSDALRLLCRRKARVMKMCTYVCVCVKPKRKVYAV